MNIYTCNSTKQLPNDGINPLNFNIFAIDILFSHYVEM